MACGFVVAFKDHACVIPGQRRQAGVSRRTGVQQPTARPAATLVVADANGQLFPARGRAGIGEQQAAPLVAFRPGIANHAGLANGLDQSLIVDTIAPVEAAVLAPGHAASIAAAIASHVSSSDPSSRSATAHSFIKKSVIPPMLHVRPWSSE